MDRLTVHFVDVFKDVAWAYEYETEEVYDVDLGGIRLEATHGSILDVEADALVSPANCFGFMDGGVEQVYLDHFGLTLQDRVQDAIRSVTYGELPVGAALCVPTLNARQPWLIVAPTMRVPSELPDDSIAPYRAMRAVLHLIDHGTVSGTETPVRDVVRTVAVPGLGTGVGRMIPDRAARLVVQAILDHVDPPTHETWLDAFEGDARLRALDDPVLQEHHGIGAWPPTVREMRRMAGNFTMFLRGPVRVGMHPVVFRALHPAVIDEMESHGIAVGPNVGNAANQFSAGRNGPLP